MQISFDFDFIRIFNVGVILIFLETVNYFKNLIKDHLFAFVIAQPSCFNESFQSISFVEFTDLIKFEKFIQDR